MSDDQDPDDKQHEATSKRLDEMKNRGQTLRSKDLSGGIMLISSILILVSMGGMITDHFKRNFEMVLGHFSNIINDPNYIYFMLRKLAISNLLMMLPFFAAMVACSFISVFIFGGWNFSLGALRFRWENFDLITNIGRLFSAKIFVDIAKGLVKFLIISSLALYYVFNNRLVIFSLPYLKFQNSSTEVFKLVENLVFSLIAGILVIMLIDAVLSYLEFQKKSKMSTQEVQDEHKASEGSGETKRKMKSMQLAILKQKILTLVPQANVVVTNPTHYAVALQYHEGKDKAPRVIAKGKGLVAKYIRSIAIAQGVIIYEEPMLARAIYHTTKLNTEVQSGLYVAVAHVLTYVNQLRHYQQGQAPLPSKSNDLKIPPEYIFNH